jgi:FkbM family methyltransferase
VNTFFKEELYFSSFETDGRRFTFLLNSRCDHIQQFLAKGSFYEREELELLSRYATGRARLLDIGANIGNHSIFLAHRLNLTRVVSIEAQPAILHILRANLGLNWHRSFDLSYIGLALSDQTGSARIQFAGEVNIGGTKITPRLDEDSFGEPAEGTEIVSMHAGDDLFEPGDFDLIKLDVESLEINVLKGLKNLLQRFRGILFIEIFDANREELNELITGIGFRKLDEYRRYARCSNIIFEK